MRARRRRPDGATASSTLRKIISAMLTVEMIMAVVAFAATVGVRVAGVETYDILSGSMEPAIRTGSLVYVKTGVPSDSIHEGDVVAFDVGNGKTVTHRVTEVNESAGTLTTKGDANADVDPWDVPSEEVIGKVVGSVPRLGDAASAFSSGKVFFLAALALFNALLFIALHFLEKEAA